MSISAVVDATKTLRSAPEQAQANFEAHHSLVGPCEVTVRVGSGHEFTVDEPEALGGGNVAANPAEYALAALGSCQAITYQVWAAQLGITLEGRPMDMWTIGFADRLRFPRFRANSEGGEMLAFAHIPTGATANEGFNIDEVNNRFAEPAVATATGADIETGRVTP